MCMIFFFLKLFILETFLWFSAQLLEAECVLPLVVAISGRVSSDTPINCEFSGLRGVIVEETVMDVIVFIQVHSTRHWTYDRVCFSLGRTTLSKAQWCRIMDSGFCTDALHEQRSSLVSGESYTNSINAQLCGSIHVQSYR